MRKEIDGIFGLEGFDKCKSCTSKFHGKIDKMLRQKVPQRQIVEWLKERGESISQASIMRHYKNHVLQGIENAGNEKYVEYASKVRSATINKNRGKPVENSPDTNPPQSSQGLNQVLIKTEGEMMYEHMKEDFDVFDEMLKTIAIQKARIRKGLQQEEDAMILLSTVDKSIQTYSNLIAKFKEMMAGSDSLEAKRMVQLQTMIAEIFSGKDFPDQVRFAMSSILLPSSTEPERVANPIRPPKS